MSHLQGAPPIWSRHAPDMRAIITTKGVMLGLPAYGGMMVEATARSLDAAQRRLSDLGIPVTPVYVRNESLVQRARNRIAAEFLASECDQLVFIDSDIGFHPDHLLRLLMHEQEMVGGMYRKKTLASVDFAVNYDVGPDGTAERLPETGLIAARHLATGFLKIRRSVFEQIRDAMPELRYHAAPGEGGEGAWRDHLHAFFDCWICPETRAYLSEDYGFCERWRALGGKLWVDPTMILEHYGQFGIWADPADALGLP